MKSDIHPSMFSKAKTKCSTCGAIFEIPSIIEKQEVEVCRMCHPMYTGKKQREMKGGRIERFKKRLEGKKKS